MHRESAVYSQIIPLAIALISALFFLILLLANSHLLNFLFPHDPIQIILRPLDLLLGLYLYIKTSVDFSVFIGSMMVANPGWKNRVAVEWGTSLGNFAGTILILWIWVVFRSIGQVFEGLIILIASFVLLELAAGSLEKLAQYRWVQAGGFKKTFFVLSEKILHLRKYTEPFLGWMPDIKSAMAGKSAPSFTTLLAYSFTIPFVLGSDDFAGYISVFNVVNVVSFAIGVIVGHGLLLAALFANPKKVEAIMENPWSQVLAIATFFAIFAIGVLDSGRILAAWGQTKPFALVSIIILLAIWSLTHEKILKTIRR